MRCPKLDELPPPPLGKTGWPWKEESRRLPDVQSNGDPWPRITVVTPSRNQGRFIEEAIRSVLLQGYPNLEYVVIDGASDDQSVEIINKYSHWLDHWSSEPDDGQSSAINRGLQMGSGLFATWINSDDMLCQNALANCTSRIVFSPDVVYVGMCKYSDDDGNILSTHQGQVHCFEDLVRLRTVWRSGGCIVQPETLFPRELVLSVGGVNTTLPYSMDYELWGKLFLAGAKFEYVPIPIGISRRHVGQKSKQRINSTDEMVTTASKLLALNTFLTEDKKKEILDDLEAYQKLFRVHYRARNSFLGRVRSGLKRIASGVLKVGIHPR